MTRYKRVATLLFVAMLAISSVAGPAAAAQVAQTNQINPDAPAAQTPYIATDVTISTFDRGDMQPLEYEDNSGEITSLNATLNRSTDVDDLGTGTVNPFHFYPSDVGFDDATAFPHDKNSVSAVNNASEWTTASTGGSITVASTTTAPGVEALEISTSSVGSGDVVNATFSNFSVTSDVEKRYLQTILDVNTLDSGANVEIQAVDADGDYVDIRINSTATQSADGVAATSTATGVVAQQQIGTLTVSGSGDGTMSEIQKLRIEVTGGDFAADISALNADRSSEWVLGDRNVDTDGSDDLETTTITDWAGGQLMIDSLSSMGSSFESATIHDLESPVQFRAVDLPTNDLHKNVTFSEAPNYPSFDRKQTARYRFVLPDAYDLSYANAVLKQTSNIPSSRYQSVQLIEGASDTAFSDLSGWTDVLDKIGSSGETVTLDSTIQPGQKIAYRSVTLVTSEEASAVQAVGGIMGPTGGGGGLLGGIAGFFETLAGKIVGVVTLGGAGLKVFGGN